MRRLLLLLFVASASMLAHGQSACAQLGVDCSHPHVDQIPSTHVCDQECRQELQRRNEEYWKRREEYNRERAEEKQRVRAQMARKKATNEANKRITEANRLSGQAWEYMQKEDCGKAVELYDKALKLTKFLQWSKNRTECLASLHRFDEAYIQWETLINDRSTPDAEIRSMRMEEWNIMYDKGYICPVPPFFNGTEGCYRRPDHKTLDTTYVPLPYIEGKTWTAKGVISSGEFTVTTRDGHEWHSGEVNMTTLNLLDARIKTGKGTVVRFLLPDDTTFALGPESDMIIDNFVYDPNESHSSMTINAVEGTFRFVSGKLSHPDPASKSISLPSGSLLQKFNRVMNAVVGFKDACMDDAHPCIINVFTRGTDVDFEHDPNGKGTWNEGMDRWWICAYDGEVNVENSGQSFPVPVGQCFIKFDHAYGWPVTYSNDHSSMDLSRNYDDSPSAEATAIRQKSRLSVTDFWDSEMAPKITGRQ